MATSKQQDPSRKATPAKPRAPRVPSGVREQQIVEAAIVFFAEKGFSGNTRDLTKGLGIAHGLLFKYFPTKEDLIDRMYGELFERRWDPGWELGVRNRAIPLKERLIKVYLDYCEVINSYEWVRVYLFGGLDGTRLNVRYWGFVRDNLFRHVIDELRFEYGKPSITVIEPTEAEFELVWSLHAALFYLGVRKWVYRLDIPADKTAAITQLVEGFLDAVPRVMARASNVVAPAKRASTRAKDKTDNAATGSRRPPKHS